MIASDFPILRVLDLGRAAYAPTLALQQRLVARMRGATGDAARGGWLLLVEHDPPVLTLGRRAEEGHLLASRERLAALGIEVHEISRGGDVTYHGPGQLVAYLILRLDLHGRDVHAFMRNLEESVIRVLARYGVAGGRVEGLTGVWVGREKVAAAGVAITRWVTYHGIALNVCPRMDHFGLIVPCGIRDRGVTSLSALAGRDVTVAEVRPALAECVGEVFGMRVVEATGEVDGVDRVDAMDMAKTRPDRTESEAEQGSERPPEGAQACTSDRAPAPAAKRAAAGGGARRGRLPVWLRKRIPAGSATGEVTRLIDELGLATVCDGAQCPNRCECFARRTATFMILGATCTRNCRFCAVPTAPPAPPDPGEPANVAEAAARLALRHVVVTSVTRDDLADGGAAHFAATIAAVRERLPEAVIEVLTPDFQGNLAALDRVLEARPDVFNHNIETVPRLYAAVRPQADYARSLAVLRHAADWRPALHVKSGLMVGLGETADEVRAVLRDLRAARVEILTLGQYLAPSGAHVPVARFVEPAEFDAWRAEAVALGFRAVAAGPFVRSSYLADEVFGAMTAAPSARLAKEYRD